MFQFRNRSGDSRLPSVQECCSLAHAARLHDGHQDMKVVQPHPTSDAITQPHFFSSITKRLCHHRQITFSWHGIIHYFSPSAFVNAHCLVPELPTGHAEVPYNQRQRLCLRWASNLKLDRDRYTRLPRLWRHSNPIGQIHETFPPKISASAAGAAALPAVSPLGRRLIRRGRCASSSALPPAAGLT